MTDPAADAARAAAAIPAPSFGGGLPAEVEAALYARERANSRQASMTRPPSPASQSGQPA
jgi:hypothetical protein